MKRFLIVAALAANLFAAPAQATDVGVSISIGQPGFYGRLDLGGFPAPALLFPQPIMIDRGPPGPPLYLRVPPGHAKDWRKHCHRYNACGSPVYFVRDDWYEREYVPQYRERHGYREERRDDRRDYYQDRRDDRRDYREDRRDDRRDYREDRRDDRRDDWGDNGRGHGHGKH